MRNRAASRPNKALSEAAMAMLVIIKEQPYTILAKITKITAW